MYLSSIVQGLLLSAAAISATAIERTVPEATAMIVARDALELTGRQCMASVRSARNVHPVSSNAHGWQIQTTAVFAAACLISLQLVQKPSFGSSYIRKPDPLYTNCAQLMNRSTVQKPEFQLTEWPKHLQKVIVCNPSHKHKPTAYSCAATFLECGVSWYFRKLKLDLWVRVRSTIAQALAEAGANVAIWSNGNKKVNAEVEKIEKTYDVFRKRKSFPHIPLDLAPSLRGVLSDRGGPF
ncbi:hypothetical protein BKA61DRAFT_571585 [Leptodontidium sp. MPI-SDFR-AT-0119]|nr:hypothetical protein BKA61DRAFT_571585 [Leptodontidium sp. MPI-SDFR-AT-0119]